MFTCILALVLAGIALIAWGQFSFRRNMVRNLSVLAQMTADNCKAALAFEDAEDATETLKALSAQPSILSADIHTKDGEEFAGYYSNGISKHPVGPHQEDGYNLSDGALAVFKSIVLDGEVVGTIRLQSDLGPLYAMMKRNTVIIVCVILFASLVAYLVSSAAQKVISDPILSLAEVAQTVSNQKDYSVRVPKESNDEVGLLITAFNEMLDQIQQNQAALIDANEQLEERVRERTAELDKTHKKLMDASRQAGMAEVATDVLHNVGNVLNSINVASTLIHEKIANSEVSNLKKVADIIHKNMDDLGTFFTQNPQGKHIPVFLAEVSKALVEEQADTVKKLRTLTENIEHIKEIVKMQQSYAKVSGVEVSVSLNELVQNAIQINSAGLERHGIDLVCDFDDLGSVSVDKQKVLQILVNLVNNAKYAMDKNVEGDKNLTIQIYAHDENKVRINVTDNGIGIEQGNLAKIFSHGFTTKTNGHGFGLHSGALAAKELGGSLTVQSEGLGHGAMFTLELPFKPAEVLG
jgi:signal transduction histidine kinase